MTGMQRGRAEDLTADLLADLARDISSTSATSSKSEPYAVESKLRLTPANWHRPSMRVGRSDFDGAIGPVTIELRFGTSLRR